MKVYLCMQKGGSGTYETRDVAYTTEEGAKAYFDRLGAKPYTWIEHNSHGLWWESVENRGLYCVTEIEVRT